MPIAVITGAVGGIGAEAASLLAARGFDLVLLNRSRARTEPLLARLAAEAPGRAVEVVEADVTDAAGMRAACEGVVARHEAVDVLICNAGVLPASTEDVGGHDATYAVNTLGAARAAVGLRPALSAAKGTVVLVSSGAAGMAGRLDPGRLSRPRKPGLGGAYGQSKLALDALAHAWAEDWARDGITLVAVDPGGNRTAMTAGAGAPWFVRMLWRALPGPEAGARRLLAPLDRPVPPGASLGTDGRPRGVVARRAPGDLPARLADKVARDL